MVLLGLFLIACTPQKESQTNENIQQTETKEKTTTTTQIPSQTPISHEVTLLKDFELIKDTGDVNVNYEEGSDLILILDYDNFAEGSGVKEEDIGSEFNNKFIIKTIDSSGNEKILDKSRFDVRRFRDEERLNAIDLLITLNSNEEGLNIYKKDNGELIYSLKFKVFSYWET